jgi:hypothetical protein
MPPSPLTLLSTLSRRSLTTFLNSNCEWNQVKDTCLKDMIGDGWCDKENNNPCCDWDGGDCCASTCQPKSTYVRSSASEASAPPFHLAGTSASELRGPCAKGFTGGGSPDHLLACPLSPQKSTSFELASLAPPPPPPLARFRRGSPSLFPNGARAAQRPR